jgi:hypothetical protein
LAIRPVIMVRTYRVDWVVGSAAGRRTWGAVAPMITTMVPARSAVLSIQFVGGRKDGRGGGRSRRPDDHRHGANPFGCPVDAVRGYRPLPFAAPLATGSPSIGVPTLAVS